jgi:hypothetical protein
VADGIDVTPGSGAKKVATDERSIGGVTQDVQRIVGIGSTSIVAGQVEVTSTTTTIVSARETRSRLILMNRQTVPVFIEMTTATTGDLRLEPGDSVTLYTTAEVDGITTNAYTAVGDAKVHYIEEYD